MRDELHVCKDGEALAQHACDWLVERIAAHRGDLPFTIALSGGSTPRRLYQLLGELPEGTVDWSRVRLLWGDERNVAPDHHDSNFRMVREALLERIGMPEDNILRIPEPGGAAEAAGEAYERVLRQALPAEEAFPAIDVVLLGLGEDVHTASLFPGTAALCEKNRWFTANHVPQLDCWRLTLTAPVINAAHNVVFLLSGRGKQAAISKLWHATLDPNLYPGQLVRPAPGQLWYLVDKDALGGTHLPESVRTEIIGS